MRNKRFSILMWSVCLILVAAALSFTAACTKEATPAATEEKVQEFVQFGVGTAGPDLIQSGALSAILNKYTGIKSTTTTALGLMAYPLMNKGDVDVTAYAGNLWLSAYYGVGVEKTKLRYLSSAGPPSVIRPVMVARTDTGIKTIADLRGKNVKCEQPGIPLFPKLMDALLKVNNMTRTDLKWISMGGADETAQALIEKRLDAAINILGTATMETQKTVGLFYVPLSPAEQAAINAAEPSLVPHTIPKGTFGIPVDTPSVAGPQEFMARAGMNDITAYTIVKALYEHLDEFHAVHDTCKGFKLENAMNEMLVPFHPGAIRYYKEMGVWTAQHEAKQKELLAKEKELFGS